MTGQGHHQPKRPDQIGGFRIGDRVLTPLGRTAIVTACRVDGLIDAKYEHQHPTLAEVILQPHTLKKAAP